MRDFQRQLEPSGVISHTQKAGGEANAQQSTFSQSNHPDELESGEYGSHRPANNSDSDTHVAAQTYSVIHNFTGGWDGGRPEAGVTIDSAGNLYGTTFAIHGSVFELTHSGSAWVLTPLYVFTGGSDGASPYAGVSIGRDGTLYSTTVEGGQGGYGTVFHLRPSSLTLSPLG